MRIAVIDIGSNTIKMAIFSYSSSVLTSIMSTTKHTGLIGYIENGLLSEKGIRVLADTVADLAAEAGRNSCFYIFPFATASLRKAENYEEILNKVKKQTGYSIDLISGKEEAAFSFDGIVRAMGKELSPCGISFDMGGGSTEIVAFDNRKATDSVSLDIGVLAIYNSFVKNIIPTQKECAKIRKHTEKIYNEVSFLKTSIITSEIYMIGGTGRALAKLHSSLTRRPFTLPYTVEYSEIETLLEQLINENQHDTKLAAIREIPTRIHTICPGICAILSLMKTAGASKLTVTNASVREGYALYIGKLNGIIND